jgi:pimeloyl-ACP methyl ester carboxylesterase
MRTHLLLTLLIAAALIAGAAPAAAQDDPPEPQRVELSAPDGLTLVANYFAPTDPGDSGAPAALLLHMLGSQKEAWGDLVPPLVEAGYAVLAVDLRGHGETGGSNDWPLAEDDTRHWLDWLREQDGIDPLRINLVGGSIGSNLALRGMANNPAVVTAVALSPGLDYRGVTTEDALSTIAERPVFLVAAQRDTYSADSVKTLVTLAQGDTRVRLYPHGAHGTGIFMLEDDLAPSIIDWLNAHN